MTSIYNSTTTTLLVDTTSTRKIVFLPVASTVGAGRLLWIKDISGNAATNGIYISTIGMDRIENRFAPSTMFAVMSTSYGSVMMTTDGILNWYFLQHYYRNAVIPGVTGTATGGSLIYSTISSTDYAIHVFTTVGATLFTVSGSISCDYLVVAGGGGGGTGRGGGGGGGGVLQGTLNLNSGSYTITVGDRGNQSINDLQGGDGGSSSIAALVVTTGGGGGGGWITNAGRSGGSGGGASAGSAASGGTGVSGQGYAGSSRYDGSTGGGGGGAGAAASGMNGAIGISSMITGYARYYAGGGGAGANNGVNGVAYGGTYEVANGTYGGGNGSSTNGTHHNYQDAVANTGGGGGGQEGYTGYSGFGGSGIVIIRYPTSFSARFTSTPRVSLQATTYSGTGTWYDSSPNGFNATLENGTVAKNNEGNGIILNGSTNWIFNDITAGNLWTCCVWYKNTGAIVGSNPCILAQIYIGNHININLGYGANIGYSFHVGGVGWAQGTSISITYPTWTNYYGVWNGTTLSTYINGIFIGSTTPGQTSSTAGSQYRIGRRWDSADYMVGQIGEVVVFNTTAFTATQVANDYLYRKSTYGIGAFGGTVYTGLLSYFSFDSDILDHRNTITLSTTGSVSYALGKYVNAVYLANEANSANGTTATNYLTSTYNLTVPFSVSLWFNPTNTNLGSVFSSYNSTGITNYAVNLYISGGTVSAAYNNIQNIGGTSAISNGTWYYAVLTVNSSNGLTLFINGSQVGSTITQSPSINGIMIGNIRDGGSSYPFSGYLDDYRIYNRVLTGTEISAIYAGTG